jgi:hypothetical protein
VGAAEGPWDQREAEALVVRQRGRQGCERLKPNGNTDKIGEVTSCWERDG